MNSSRRGAAFGGGALLLVLLFEYWLAELGTQQLTVVAASTVVAVLVVPGVWLAFRRTWRGAVLLALAVLVTTAVGHLLGTASLQRAFNECVEHCERVRSDLDAHRGRKGTYPLALSEIEGVAGLCKRVLAGDLLKYKSIDGLTYELSFSDGFVEHTASNESGCSANK